VSDTGVGIAPEDQEAVFEEFRQVGTTDKKVEGNRPGADPLPKVRRAAWRQDLGQEPVKGWLDIHVHDSGAWPRMSWATRRSRSASGCKHRSAPPSRLYPGSTQEVAPNESQRAPKPRTSEALIYEALFVVRWPWWQFEKGS